MSFTPNPPLEPLSEPSGENALPAAHPSALLPENPPWGFVDVILVAVFSLIAVVMVSGVTIAFVHAIPRWRHFTMAQLAAEPLAMIPAQTVADLLTLFLMMLIVQRGDSGSFWAAVKWQWPVNAFPYLVAGLGLSLLVQIGSSVLPIPKSLPIDEFFKTTHSAWTLAVFGIFVAPFFEELFFRGFFYPVLYRRIGFFAAMVVNSLLFAFVHEGQLARAWAPLLVLFVVGCVLTYVRKRTQSVSASFLVHAGYNAFLFGMIFVATGGFRHMDKLR